MLIGGDGKCLLRLSEAISKKHKKADCIAMATSGISARGKLATLASRMKG